MPSPEFGGVQPAPFEPLPFQPHEREIHRLLGVMGDAPADQYADAIRILRGNPPLQTRSLILAHIAREIDSALRELLYSLVPVEVQDRLEAEKPEDRRDPDRALVIDEICSALGFDSTDEIRSVWKKSGAWHNAAHRGALLANRPADAAFIERWDRLGTVLKVVLRAYEGSFTRALPMIDELATADPISKEKVSHLLNRVPNSAPALNRFFEHASAAWFPHLLKRNYFRSPPPLQPSEDGLLTYKPWPPGRYLIRMMQEPKLVPDVIDVVLQLETDNPQAAETVADVALAAPIALARPLAGKIAQLLRSPAQWALPSKATELLPRLAADGRLDEAATILAELLPSPTRRGAGGGFIPSELVIQLFPQLGVPGLAVFAARLAQREDGGRDELSYSRIWWPDITSGRIFRARDELVTMLRDAAIAVATEIGPEQVVCVLDAHPGGIFRRLALHILLLSPEPELVSEWLTGPALFHDRDCFVEYGHLLATHFGSLEPDDRNRVLALIDQGPIHTDDPAAIKRWKHRQFARFGDALPGAYRAEKEALVRELGDPGITNHVIEFKDRSSADRADLPLPALDEMTDDDLISSLTGWTPTGRWDDPDRDDLRQRIQVAAAKSPRRFAALAPRFLDLDPTYARGLLQGLRQAIECADDQQGSAAASVADWQPVLDFAAASLTQRAQLPERPTQGDGEQDPGWNWAWQELAELLTAGLRSDIPQANLEQALAVISQLLDADDSTDDDGPPFETAINSIGGNAWIALLQYAIRLHSPAAPVLDAAVRQLLEKHLNPARRPNSPIRSLYGYKIHVLNALDEQWTRQHLDQIFPHVTKPGIASAAWNAYLMYGRLTVETATLLHPLYQWHTMSLSHAPEMAPPIEGVPHEQPEDRLLEHLGLLYRDGAIPPQTGWLADFFNHAPLRLRARLIEHIGRQLHSSGQLDQDQTNRLKVLWEKRRDAATQAGGNAAELAGFGVWFSSGKLPDAWALDQLNQALAAGTTLASCDDIAERLTTLGADELTESVTAIAGLVDAPDRPWFISSARASISAVLRNGLQAADPETRRNAEQTVSRLVARGHSNFGSLTEATAGGDQPPATAPQEGGG
ncbi:hypothetical protein ABT344_30155 [Micromonospora carbonacea]|uniref:hypothetical protein n=1 Tax=Micromonospora carbonacea TaxID=47853 RepID=UPI00331F5980